MGCRFTVFFPANEHAIMLGPWMRSRTIFDCITLAFIASSHICMCLFLDFVLYYYDPYFCRIYQHHTVFTAVIFPTPKNQTLSFSIYFDYFRNSTFYNHLIINLLISVKIVFEMLLELQ